VPLQPTIDGDAAARQLLDLGKQRLRIDHHAVADQARDAGMEDPRGNQVQHELLAVHIHGVSGVVATLIPRDGREMRRQHVDDLAFPFVAPLCAQNSDIRVHPTVHLIRRSTRSRSTIAFEGHGMIPPL
jgi:hypothetical protein